MKATSGWNCLALILCALFFLASTALLAVTGPTSGGTSTSTGTTGGSYTNGGSYVYVCLPGSRIRIPSYYLTWYQLRGWKVCL